MENRLKRFARALRVVPIFSLAFAGCTCGGSMETDPPPTLTPRATTATPAPPAAPAPTNPPQQPAAAPAAALPAAPPAAPAAAEVPTAGPVDDEVRAQCESFVSVIVGQKQDAKLLDDPKLRELAAAHRELVVCGAVRRDSGEFCKLAPTEGGSACREIQAVFHELRTNPGKRTYMFTEVDWQLCRGVPALVQACDGVRDAVRSGKVDDCAKAGGAEPLCRAYLTLDRSQCQLTGELAAVEFSLPDVKEGEPASIKVAEAAAQDCRAKIERRTVLDQGLQKLAESGPLPERELAKAALGQADACAPYAAAALDACTAGPPNAGGAPNATPGAGAPPPPADAPAGAPAEGNAQG